jgi:hypothetical protein
MWKVSGDKKLAQRWWINSEREAEFFGSELSGPFRDDTNSRKKESLRILNSFETFW